MGLVSAFALGGLVMVQAASQPASSVPAAGNVVSAYVAQADHGYRADIVDDIIDLINDLLNPPPPPPPPPPSGP